MYGEGKCLDVFSTEKADIDGAVQARWPGAIKGLPMTRGARFYTTMSLGNQTVVQVFEITQEFNETGPR